MATRIGTRLGVFAKYWQPGNVKSRLAATIGDEAAAELYREFLQLTVERLSGIGHCQELCCSPAGRMEEFRQIAPSDWVLTSQSSGDLGHRMQAFFDQAFRSGASRVVLIGSDTPDLPRSRVREAFARLQDVEVVLGPSSDGGYYLIGGRNRLPSIFRDIPWSSGEVFERTIQTLNELGLQEGPGYQTLASHDDIDTIDDLRGLSRRLAATASKEESLSRLAIAVDRCLANT